jgi:aminoglycoside phosphotransferase (APT) family kinase protein
MATMSTKQRDLDALRGGFANWLQKQWPSATDLRVGPVGTSPTSGFSSESLFVDATYVDGGTERTEHLVARLPPPALGIFPTYDLEAQWRVQDIIGRHGVPVAPMIGYEPDSSWVGSPFLMMRRVDGDIPADQPPYMVEGWLHDATAEDQQAVCEHAIATMVDIHHLDWQALGLDFLERPGGVGLVGEMEWWHDYASWASEGSPPSLLNELYAWCHEHRPDPEPEAGLVWGDARTGNMIFGPDRRPVAVLDWEMATLGPPELDLGLFLSVRHMFQQQTGIPDPELPGFPTKNQTVAIYERLLGRPVDHLQWYEAFAMYRTGSIVVSVKRLYQLAGLDLPIEPVPDWVAEMINNPE